MLPWKSENENILKQAQASKGCANEDFTVLVNNNRKYKRSSKNNNRQTTGVSLEYVKEDSLASVMDCSSLEKITEYQESENSIVTADFLSVTDVIRVRKTSKGKVDSQEDDHVEKLISKNHNSKEDVVIRKSMRVKKTSNFQETRFFMLYENHNLINLSQSSIDDVSEININSDNLPKQTCDKIWREFFLPPVIGIPNP
jgi:hypothetical protein